MEPEQPKTPRRAKPAKKPRASGKAGAVGTPKPSPKDAAKPTAKTLGAGDRKPGTLKPPPKSRSNEKTARTQRKRSSAGFDEAQLQRGFEPADMLRAIFDAYGGACAFTGKDLRREAAADPGGYLLNLGEIQTTDPALLIPATLDAIFAFEHGHLALGARYNFLVDLDLVDPEFLETLNPIGRLRLPSDPRFIPSQAALTPHLIAFATGRRPRD